jgi:hypothetical protein
MKPTEKDYEKFQKLLEFFVKQWEVNARYEGKSGENTQYGETYHGTRFEKFNNFGFSQSITEYDILTELGCDNIDFKFGNGYTWTQPGNNFLTIGWINIVPKIDANAKKVVGFRTEIAVSETKAKENDYGMCHLEYKKNYDIKYESIKVENSTVRPDDSKRLFDNFVSIIQGFNEFVKRRNTMKAFEEYLKLLTANRNLILTGAPGTGKTYLAKQIALQIIFKDSEKIPESEDELTDAQKKQFREQLEFVQFHPSYDYTDFVEGLRPKKEEGQKEIGFELKNGIFKEFCERARKTWFEQNSVEKEDDGNYHQVVSDKTWNKFNNAWNNFIVAVEEKNKIGETYNKVKKFNGENMQLRTTNGKLYIVTAKSTLVEIHMGGCYNRYLRLTLPDNYYKEPVIKHLKEQFGLEDYDELSDGKKYIFVIDEINRGEISKIFGELFFSIDPSYRGIEGAVKTQYSNMHDDETEIFYVPKNVYIIGTMNDIDRSVESFDFAMRRRFTWKEITAKESQIMFNKTEWSAKLKEKVKNRMDSLNNAIWNEKEKKGIEGLSSSYHIGGAYFLKLDNYKDMEDHDKFNNLWKYHLKPLLKEYLRGMPDAETRLTDLENAYNEQTSTKANKPENQESVANVDASNNTNI